MNRFGKWVLVAMLLGLANWQGAKAQVFILDEEEYTNSKRAGSVGGGLAIVPDQDVTTDQFAPLGSGVGLLCGFGLALALFRKKQNAR